VDDILDREGLAGLDRLPGIGQILSRVIDQIVRTGPFPMLERLRGTHMLPAATLPPAEPSVVEVAGNRS
jgi:hypothetical protein